MADFPYSINNVTADGMDIFYREAGHVNSPVLLLLHGFPTSSHQYRNLIPLLATAYHVIAPDYPSFGFTTVPSTRNYTYTFANLANTMSLFLDALGVKKHAMYIFDYGAPIGFRMALKNPESITAIVSQNGNTYVEGLGQLFWAPVERYWASGSEADREALLQLFSFNHTKEQYTGGEPAPWTIKPETYNLDYYLLNRPGNANVQLDLFYDYRNNVALYPSFQQYLRTSQVPLLAAWGKNDIAFIPAGAEAFKKDLPKAEIHLLDAGHFAVETKTVEIAELMLDFLRRHGI